MNRYVLDALLDYIDARIDEKLAQNDGTSRAVQTANAAQFARDYLIDRVNDQTAKD